MIREEGDDSLIIFFFSSRRRHTRCYRDWSSDVCSSDLEAIISEIDTATGTTYVYSGASGRLIYQLDGTESELHGYAIADAGDVNGDGVSDILSGAPSSAGHRGPGHLYLYSGRTGARLHAFVGETAN